MLTEAARQTQAAGVTNVTWAQGGSEDLRGNVGSFRPVTMGRSFHWMNREQVLTVLKSMIVSAVEIHEQPPQRLRTKPVAAAD